MSPSSQSRSSICVIGGAGYIGSVAVEALIAAGRRAVVYDNLSKGHRAAVPEEVPFIFGDHGDEAHLKETLEKYNCSAVMHFSASSLVGESMKNPLLYYENNVIKGLALLRASSAAGVRHFIFSSTAATYGEPVSIPIKEDDPAIPTNPYGNTKLAFERMLRDFGGMCGMQSVSLRYFNAAGATERCGEAHNPETHLIPLTLQVAAGRRSHITVFGKDYPTPDGSCIRDYIHVADLASAHIQALEYLENDGETSVFNLGNEKGFSVFEVIETARKVTGCDIPAEIAERRAGDPAILVASSERIKKVLGWQPQYPQLDDIIASAWRWHSAHPNGYMPERKLPEAARR